MLAIFASVSVFFQKVPLLVGVKFRNMRTIWGVDRLFSVFVFVSLSNDLKFLEEKQSRFSAPMGPLRICAA